MNIHELVVCYFNNTVYKTGYTIEGLPDFNYKTTVKIGKTVFTGKDFIAYIDFMINIGLFKECKHITPYI